MARQTEFLNLYLPDVDDVYNVETDQNENFEKIDAKLKEWDTGKENTIDKKTGFNLDKSDNYMQNTSTLLTTKGSANLYNDLQNKINTLCPYKVGDIYITTSTQNPAVTWVGTSWQKIEGRFLRSTTSSESAGITAGSDTKTLSVANLPAHSHSGSTESAGSHTHTQVAHSHTQPAHTHGIKDSYEHGSSTTTQYWGDGGTTENGFIVYTVAAGGENTGGAAPAINANGAHTHTVSIGNTGSGSAFDIKPAYITVHIWKRLS